MDNCQIHANQELPCPRCARYSARYDKAYTEGKQAQLEGLSMQVNPYKYKNNAQEHGWRIGWLHAYWEANPRPASLYYKQYKES